MYTHALNPLQLRPVEPNPFWPRSVSSSSC